MTTLRDMIKDFGQECINIGATEDYESRVQEEMLEQELDDLIETIKERIVG